MKRKLIPLLLGGIFRKLPSTNTPRLAAKAAAKWNILAAAATMAGMLSSAHGAVIEIDLTTTFSGTAPSNTYTATFNDTACGANCVQLTMSTSGSSTTEFIDGVGTFGWGFNFDPTKNLASLVFTSVSGNNADAIQTGADAFKADGDGLFDILFAWDPDPASRFSLGNDSTVYNITGITGLTVADFNFLSADASGNGTHWTSAAHVQGIPTGEGSGWIGGTCSGDCGGGPPQRIPEPESLSLLGLGLIGLAAGRRRRTI